MVGHGAKALSGVFSSELADTVDPTHFDIHSREPEDTCHSMEQDTVLQHC